MTSFNKHDSKYILCWHVYEVLRDFWVLCIFFTNFKRDIVYLFVFIHIKPSRLYKREPIFLQEEINIKVVFVLLILHI